MPSLSLPPPCVVKVVGWREEVEGGQIVSKWVKLYIVRTISVFFFPQVKKTIHHCHHLIRCSTLKLLLVCCYVKRVAHSDEPTENYQPTFQFPSVLQSVLESLCSLFGFTTKQLYGFGSVSLLSCFQMKLFLANKAPINPLCATFQAPNSRQS